VLLIINPTALFAAKYEGRRRWTVGQQYYFVLGNLAVTKTSLDLNEQPYTQEAHDGMTYTGYTPAHTNFSATWTGIVNGDRTVFEWRVIESDEYININCIRSSGGPCNVTLSRDINNTFNPGQDFSVPQGQIHDIRLERIVLVQAPDIYNNSTNSTS
jgi:hypothetical protein